MASPPGAGPAEDPAGNPAGDPAGAPPPPASAHALFGDALPLAMRYADLLAGEGSLRGLIGPREVPRLWERHLVNCAVLGELVPASASVCDLGSGAGLPGIPLALCRPDLSVTLLEPLLRRTRFLEEAVAALGLVNVDVRRGRAEELRDGDFEVVTSRAVAPLPRLAGWSLPLVRAGGQMLAVKGGTAAGELADAARVLADLGGTDAEVLTLGADRLDEPVTVIRVRKSVEAPPRHGGPSRGARRRSSGRSARGRGAGRVSDVRRPGDAPAAKRENEG